MIRYVQHADIDKRAWDEQLARDPEAQWYGLSATLDAAAPGWDALIDEEAGQQLAIPWRRKFGIVYTYQPFLIQQLGPYGTGRSPRDTARFLAELPARFRYADIYLCGGDADQASPEIAFTRCTNLLLSLDAPAEALRAAYSENLRRNLRKATVPEAAFDEAVPVDELLAFLTGSEQFRRWRIAPRQVAAMERILRSSIDRGEGESWGIRHAGALAAGAFFVRWGGRSIFLKGLTNAQGRELRAMHALIDRYIGRHAGTGLVLDFAGSNDPDLARFYSGFGAQPAFYLRALVNRLPALIRRTKT